MGNQNSRNNPNRNTTEPQQPQLPSEIDIQFGPRKLKRYVAIELGMKLNSIYPTVHRSFSEPEKHKNPVVNELRELRQMLAKQLWAMNASLIYLVDQDARRALDDYEAWKGVKANQADPKVSTPPLPAEAPMEAPTPFDLPQ